LLNMRVRQVDLASRVIQLDAGTTKNDEARIAPMTDELATLLTACIIGKGPDDYVFTRLDKTPVKGLCCAVPWDSVNSSALTAIRNWKSRRLTPSSDVLFAARSGSVSNSSTLA
jgi:integrase